MGMAVSSPRLVRPGDMHLWLAGAGLLVVCACLSLLGAAIVRDAAQPFQRVRPAAAAASPVPRPDDAAVLLNNNSLAIAPTDAMAINAARPVDRTRVIPARSFVLPPAIEAAAFNAAADCLTQAIYYEAASESDTGERAVAQVVLNRVRNPLFPHSVCGVVFQGSQQRTGCQFSFTCDGSLARRPSLAGWARARRIALAALAGTVERSVGLSTHYHADFVVPYWASSLDKVTTIGAHIFYNMRGGRGRPASFREPYDAAGEALGGVLPAATELDALAGADGVAGAAIQPPRDRTIVTEDALGAPAATVVAPMASTGLLKADEARGELMVDRKPANPGARSGEAHPVPR